jgi:hypothetical protein
MSFYVCRRCNAPVLLTGGHLDDVEDERKKLQKAKAEMKVKNEKKQELTELGYSITNWFKGRDSNGLIPMPRTQTIDMPSCFTIQEVKDQMNKIKGMIENANYTIKDMKTAYPSEDKIHNEFEPMCFMACYDTGVRDVVVKYVMVTLNKHYIQNSHDIEYYISCRFFHQNEQEAAQNTWKRGNTHY